MIIRRISTGSYLTRLKDEDGACLVWGEFEDAKDVTDSSIPRMLEKYDPFNYEYLTVINCENGYFCNQGESQRTQKLVFEIEEFLNWNVVKGRGKLLYLPHDQAVKALQDRTGRVKLYWKRCDHQYLTTWELRIK